MPIIQGNLAAGPALNKHENTSPSAEAWCKLSKIITDGSSEAPFDIEACSAICPRYCLNSLEDLWSTLKKNINLGYFGKRTTNFE